MSARDYFREERAVERREFHAALRDGALTGEFVVRGYSIITTDLVVFNAWEPLIRESGRYSHSTSFTSADYGSLGAVRSRVLPPEVESYQFGPERTHRVRAHHDAQDLLSEEIIRAAFPEFVSLIRFREGEGHASLAELTEAS